MGAATVTLSFSSFDTDDMNGYDYIQIYDDQYQSNLLGTFSGNTIPSSVISTTGQMLVIFYSDGSFTSSGWDASYTSFIEPTYCSGQTNLTASSDSFSDGSGANNYSDNSSCSWYIHPMGATTVTLSFSSFNTDDMNGYDYIQIYDDQYQNNLLGSFSGSTIPSPIISTTGQMLVIFYSDAYYTSGGWDASYTSSGGGNGTPYCNGLTDLTASSGSFSDGSGVDNYNNNSNCSWYIHPVNASSVSLSFSSFQTESEYDFISVYDDQNQTNLLAEYSGDTIPSSITSTTGKMYVVFFSDGSDNFSGWDASYTSSSTGGGGGSSPYCNGQTDLTTPTGTLSDGSSANNYSNNSDCSWYIHPSNASSITLSFTSFNTESGYDFVKIYDHQNKTNLLGSYSGANTISPITSTTGEMLVVFSSNGSTTNSGWDANYTSIIRTTGIEQNLVSNTLKIIPNPNNGIFSLSLDHLSSATEEIKIFNSVGQIVWSNTNLSGQTKYEIDLSEFNSGLYLVVVTSDNKRETKKIIVNK